MSLTAKENMKVVAKQKTDGGNRLSIETLA